MAAAEKRAGVQSCNVVQSERIWKDYVYREIKAVQQWHKTWGFMRQKYKDLNKEILDKRLECLQSSSFAKAKCDIDMLTLTRQTNVSKVPVIPPTTSKNIGWRANYTLERYGRFSRPRRSILRQLDWPVDAIS